MKRNTELKKIALASLICALSCTVLFLGNILSVADLTACAVASALLYLVRAELNLKYQILIYAVTSTLLLVLSPTMSASIFYVAFFGLYPLIKDLIEKAPKILIYIIKLALFNADLLILFKMFSFLFIAEGESTDNPLLIGALLLANIFFLVYDIALTFGVLAYKKHYRSLWKIDRLMK